MVDINDRFGEWCTKSICPIPGLGYSHDYSQSALNILRFLAETTYSPSLYDLAHGVKILRQSTPGRPKEYEFNPLRDEDTKIGYSYSLIHRSVNELVEDNLVSETTVMTGSRGKKVLNITIQGLLLFIKAWKKMDDVAISSIKVAIRSHNDLLHIADYVDRLVDLVGLEIFHELARLSDIPYKKVQFSIQDHGIDFVSFIPEIRGLTGALIIGNISERREFSHENPVLRLIYELSDLARIFQAYLALKDLFSWYVGLLDEARYEEWNSERISAYLEQREVKDNSIFHNRRYRDFFSNDFDLGCVIVGALLERLVLEKQIKQPVSRFGVIKNGIAITLI